jgi:hypothetical protein
VTIVNMPTPTARAVRLWLIALFVALVLESVALAVFTPATFMIFVVFGIPLSLAAGFYFGMRALRALTRRGVL